MGLTVTVLGCSGSYPGPGLACSSYLVRSSATTLWIDAGSGSLANLQRHVGIADVDAVVLSHEHPDHTGDLAGFYVASKYDLGREIVPVFAPEGVARTLYYRDHPIRWHDVEDGARAMVADLQLSFSRTDHAPETLAVRVDGEGRSVGYSADSGPAWSLSSLGPGLDLAICEATYLSDSEGKARHMSARQAGRSGREAGVGRLVLTHQYPGTDAAAIAAEGSAAFGRPVDVAFEGAVYEV